MITNVLPRYFMKHSVYYGIRNSER